MSEHMRRPGENIIQIRMMVWALIALSLVLYPAAQICVAGNGPVGDITAYATTVTDGSDATPSPTYEGKELVSWPKEASADVVWVERDCTLIRYGAFMDSGEINKVVIPSTCTIDQGAFIGSKVKEIEITGTGQRDYKYENGAILSYDGTQLWCYLGGREETSYRVPDTVTTINACAFDGNEHLKSVYIGDQVTKIGEFAFRSCFALEAIHLPDSDTPEETQAGSTVIGDAAFSNCIKLQELTLPATLQIIPAGMVNGCQSLRKIVVPAGVKTVRSTAFWTGSWIRELFIYSHDLKPGEAAASADMKWSYYLPVSAGANNVSSNSDYEAYSINGGLTYLYTYEDSPYATYLNDASRIKIDESESYTIVWRNLASKAADLPDSGTCGTNAHWSVSPDGKTLTITGTGDIRDYVLNNTQEAPWMQKYGNTIENLIIEDGITTIGEFAFYGMPKLASVTMPDSIVKIRRWAFANCSSLTSIQIGGDLRYVDNYAFAFCQNLKDVTFLGTVGEIYGAFQNCISLQNVQFAGTVTSLRDLTFAGCRSLQRLDLLTVRELGDKLFPGCQNLRQIYLSKIETIQAYAFSGVTAEVYLIAATGESGLANKDYGGSLTWFVTACDHEWAIETIPATCTDEGQKYSYCEKCGAKAFIESIPATGHRNLTYVGRQEATETADGNNAYYHCNDCGKNFADEHAYKVLTASDIVIPKGSNTEPSSGSGGSSEGGSSSGGGGASSGGGSSAGGGGGGGVAIPTQPSTDPADPTDPTTPSESTSPTDPAGGSGERGNLRQKITGTSKYTKRLGQRFRLNAKGKTSLAYTSSNPKVATVDEKGLVTIVGLGKTTITVTAAASVVYAKAVKKIKIVGTLAKPVLKAKNKSGRQVKLTWNRVPQATGYKLYVKVPGQKKFRLAVTKSARVKSVTHKGLTKGKTYKYKIRAFKKVGKKIVYSKYSKTISVKVKR